MGCHGSYHAGGTRRHCDLQTFAWYEEGIVFRTCFMVGIGDITRSTQESVHDSCLRPLSTARQTLRIIGGIVLRDPARRGVVESHCSPLRPPTGGSRIDGCWVL